MIKWKLFLVIGLSNQQEVAVEINGQVQQLSNWCGWGPKLKHSDPSWNTAESLMNFFCIPPKADPIVATKLRELNPRRDYVIYSETIETWIE